MMADPTGKRKKGGTGAPPGWNPGGGRAGDDRLVEYRAKRRASRTPEPFGGASLAGSRLFVVQQHDASRLHWDFRLELDGALLSWAVPKGPSPNPEDKRMAVRVEDHPLDYAEFEGVIPEGNYGAGSVILWDKGVWVPTEDPHAGLASGKLLFDLRGFKLNGRWTLVKTRQSENSWLLIKEFDSWVDERGPGVYPAESIYSGLSVDEVAHPERRQTAVEARARDLGAREGRVASRTVRPMLATARDAAFTRPGWIFEIKYDGYRVVAAREGGEAALRSRNGNDLTATFPEIARAVRGLPFGHAIVDGEVVVHDAAGLPSFSRLQKRGRLRNRADIQRASVALPAHMYVFDLLAVGDLDLRALPLRARKRTLRELLPPAGPLRYCDHIEEAGEKMYEHAIRMRLEGVVAKKADSVYESSRSGSWRKIRAVRTGDFVVVGWSESEEARPRLSSLHLAGYRGDVLVRTGSVGTGFASEQLDALRETLLEIEVSECPATGEGTSVAGRAHRWVRPELVAEVRYAEWTEARQLRHPSFGRLREDKRPRECFLEEDEAPREALSEPLPTHPPDAARAVRFTNLDKVFWPEEGYTKGDLIDYYGTVSPWLLPYLEDRALVMTRYPDGIDGKSFYQKDAPGWAPEWIRTETVFSESTGRDLNHFVADSPEALLYIANMATIPLHIWHSRLETPARPDWCVLDLDPKEASFADVIAVARRIRRVCGEAGLPCHAKTSGSSGLHVLIPLGRRCTYEQSQLFGELMSRVVAAELPEIATVERRVSRREGKVYLDYLQNGHGKLIAAPFCVRPKPGAPVSMPLEWDEVEEGLAIGQHTIRTAPARMAALGRDPLAKVLEEEPDLVAALERLTERFG